MVNIQIASDLHIEYESDSVLDPLDFITPSADILILAGDIGSFYKFEQLATFIQVLCEHFQFVLYVPGNHEWYIVQGQKPISLSLLKERMRKIENSISNLYILDRNSVLIGNLCIAGATLWSNPQCQVPPFIVRIHGMRTREYKIKHKQDLKYIKTMIKYCKNEGYKLFVVTHHPPTRKVLDNNSKRKKFSSLYVNDLDYLINKNNINTWVCGHVHKNFDFISNGCRIVGNQKGKKKDYIKDYSKKFVITL